MVANQAAQKAPEPATGATRRTGHRWKPGESGNPSGRRKTASLAKLCRTFTAEAVDKIIDIMRADDTPKSTALRAAQELLDRGWGKPQSSVHVTTGEAASLSTAELEAVVAGGQPGPETEAALDATDETGLGELDTGYEGTGLPKP